MRLVMVMPVMIFAVVLVMPMYHYLNGITIAPSV